MKKKEPVLKVLNFPKQETPPGEMLFDVVHLKVQAEDANRVIAFLTKHAAELPPTPQNLLGLVWCATRSLMAQGVPGEIAGMMVDRACNWIDEGPKPGRKKKP